VDEIPCIIWNSVTFTILGRVDYVNFSNDTMKTKEESLKIGVKRYLYNASIRKIRKQKNITQIELSDKSDVTITKIRDFERLRRVPTPDEAGRIADVLGVPAVEIFPVSLYKQVVERVENIQLDYYFDVTPASLCEREIYQLEAETGRVEDIEADFDRKYILRKYLKELQEREKRVLSLRFGLEDGVFKTLEEVGKEFGVTRERIRGIEHKAMKKLRKMLREDNLSFNDLF
jgi:RNA polymerase sigma factor (sigma-70 family)